MGRRHATFAVFVAALLLLSACSRVIKAYPGPELPTIQTALVQGGAYTEIVSLDGRPAASWGEMSVLPGPHTITMRIFDQGPTPMSVQYAFYSLSDGSISFVAEPGHRYVVSVDVNASPFLMPKESDTGFGWVGYVTDRTSKQVVARTDYMPAGVWPRMIDLGVF